MDDTDLILSLSDIKALKGITFTAWNIRSMFSKFEEILQCVIISDVEFLIITETWLNNNIPDDFIRVDGYNMFRLDCDPGFGRTRGGGIVIYAKTRFNCVLCEYLNIQDYHVEMLTFRLKLTHVRDIYVICIYRPPSGDVKSFIDLVESKLNIIRTNHQIEILILGDINIDSKRNNNNSKIYKEFLKRNNLINLINSNTHFNRNDISVSAVDHVLNSDPDMYWQHGIIPLSVSDHYAVFGTRKKFKTKQNKRTTRARSYSKYDPTKLSHNLDTTDWSDIFDCTDANTAWDLFVCKFTS